MKKMHDRKASMSVAGSIMPISDPYSETLTISPIKAERRNNASTLRPKMKKKFPDLSIEDVIGTSGYVASVAAYKTPSNEMLLKKPLLGLSSKKKLVTYVEEI